MKPVRQIHKHLVYWWCKNPWFECSVTLTLASERSHDKRNWTVLNVSNVHNPSDCVSFSPCWCERRRQDFRSSAELKVKQIISSFRHFNAVSQSVMFTYFHLIYISIEVALRCLWVKTTRVHMYQSSLLKSLSWWKGGRPQPTTWACPDCSELLEISGRLLENMLSTGGTERHTGQISQRQSVSGEFSFESKLNKATKRQPAATDTDVPQRNREPGELCTHTVLHTGIVQLWRESAGRATSPARSSRGALHSYDSAAQRRGAIRWHQCFYSETERQKVSQCKLRLQWPRVLKPANQKPQHSDAHVLVIGGHVSDR